MLIDSALMQDSTFTLAQHSSVSSAKPGVRDASAKEVLKDGLHQDGASPAITQVIIHSDSLVAYSSAEKAKQVLGWQPLFTLDEGLQQTIDWYKRFFSV